MHVKFHPETGDELSGHRQPIQIRSVSIYLFYLAHIVRGGLVLVYTLQEYHIIQNLVYYIECAYRSLNREEGTVDDLRPRRSVPGGPGAV